MLRPLPLLLPVPLQYAPILLILFLPPVPPCRQGEQEKGAHTSIVKARLRTSRRGSGPGAYGEWIHDRASGSFIVNVKGSSPAIIYAQYAPVVRQTVDTRACTQPQTHNHTANQRTMRSLLITAWNRSNTSIDLESPVSSAMGFSSRRRR